MGKAIRSRDEEDWPPEGAASTEGPASTLTGAARLMLGLGALPLIGIGLLLRQRGSGPALDTLAAGTVDRDSEEVAHDRVNPDPPSESDLPSRQEVEAALRRLTEATIPKAPPKTDGNPGGRPGRRAPRRP